MQISTGAVVRASAIAALFLVSATRLVTQAPQDSTVTGQAQAGVGAAEIPVEVIVVRSPEEAEQILERLRSGDDFAAVAKEKSIDPTASAGGYLGKIAPRILRAELRKVLDGLAPGQVSPVARIPEGYAILKVTTKEPADAGATPAAILALSSRGSVKPTLLVSGLPEAEEALRRYLKPEGWELDPHKTCQARKESLSSATGQLERMLAAANQSQPNGAPTFDTIQLHYFLGELYLYEARMEPAAVEFEKAYQAAQAVAPAMIPQLEETLGIVYLQKSGMENGAFREPGDRCLFPPRVSAPYKRIEDSEKAVEHFEKFLEKKPNEIDVQWLLNMAYLTLGKYPAGVPKKYLVPASLFESKEDVGRFMDVAPQAGLNLFEMAGGLIVDDFENDGRFDVVTSSFDMCAPMHFFHNNGDGTFTDKAKEAGVSDQLSSLNMIQADYNNDGCTDILMMRGAWEVPQRMSLLKNNCNGTFTDVTAASGLGKVATATQAGVWADVNNDGLLDLFVGSENGPSQLFLNKGDGTFEDISHTAGVDKIAYTKGVVAADYDNDGYVDLYVSNLGRNFLYHNNHDNTFSELAEKAGVTGPGQSFATWFFDYDNDGLPDLFVTGFSISVDETVRTYTGAGNDGPTLKLYKNLGNGKFGDVTRQAGLEKGFMPMGANFGDIDNDGFLDIYLGTGSPSLGSMVPNVLLRNHDGRFFTDVTSSSGTGELHKGHAVAFADMEHNGHEDILAEIGGAVPNDSHTFRLFKNPGGGNDWISVKLQGVKTNRAAIGARIKVTVRSQGQGSRSIYRWVGSGGSFGSSPLEQHIGLGKGAVIEELEVWWPVSKTRQAFSGVEKNQFLTVKEFEREYARVERKRYQLGGDTTNK